MQTRRLFDLNLIIGIHKSVTADLSRDPFWDLPSNLSSASPGDILTWQDVDAVAAARLRVEDLLSDEWVAVGQSEGGMTAWRLNQRLAVEGQQETLGRRAGTFLGSVAIAPASRVIDIIDALKDAPASNDGGVHEIAAYVMRNLAGLYPDRLRLEDYLTETARARLDLIGQSCLYGVFEAFGYMTPAEFYMDPEEGASWTRHPAVADWREVYNREGLTELAAPLMVVQGTQDGIVPPFLTEEDYARTCVAHPDSHVRFLTYAGQNHGSVTNSAQVDYMGWVDDLPQGDGAGLFAHRRPAVPGPVQGGKGALANGTTGNCLPMKPSNLGCRYLPKTAGRLSHSGTFSNNVFTMTATLAAAGLVIGHFQCQFITQWVLGGTC
ncbi:alpha/beta-hydrolase [Apiospora sp. TS-2023a]